MSTALVAAPLRCADVSTPVSLVAGEVTTLGLAGSRSLPGPVYLEITERGRDIEWRLDRDEAFAAVSPRPPRLGMLIVAVPEGRDVQLRLADRNAQPGHADVRLHCQAAGAHVALADCLDAARNAWIDWSRFSAMWRAAPTPCKAFAVHESAARASERADYDAAIALYTSAAETWRRLGDPAREAAALLGLAERLADAGLYEAAMAAVARAVESGQQAGVAYYAVRAEATRCLFLDDMGRRGQATACMRPIPDAFAALGDSGEAANAWNNLAAFDLDRGDIAGARADLERARAVTGPLSVRIRARLHLMDARVSAAEGRFQNAMAALQASFDAVEDSGDQRWRANVLLQAARLYQLLSAPLEARVMAERAHALYRALAAPERIAAVTTLIARLDLDQGEAASAVGAAEAAAGLYAQSGMHVQELGARILAARAGSAVAWQDIDRLLVEAQTVDAWQMVHIEIARIERVIDHATPAQADAHATRLAALAAQVDDVGQWLDIRRLQARALLRADAPAAAMAMVESALQRHRALARAARVPALRQMLLRQSRPLAASWVDAVLALPSAQRPDPARVREQLHWLHGTRLLRPRGDDLRRADPDLDQELASLLRAGDGEGPQPRLRAQRSLLALFAGAEAAVDLEPMAAPASAAPLPDGVVRLSYGFGERGALVVVERAGVLSMLPLPQMSNPAQHVQRLARLVQQRDARLDEIDVAARALAALILPAQLGLAPAQLWVDWDPTLAAVPFALLPWPGQDWPMVDDTAVSRRLGIDASPLRPPAGIDLLVAARPAGIDSTILPYLAGAEREPALIADAFTHADVHTHAGRDGGRTRLQSLLAQPGTWLHVAAHGVSRTGIQGLAGLWLAPERDGDDAQFVSWLGLANAPLSADLVVLNACQLADSDVAVNAAIGFATALAAAGVDHVVAANWQLSDSASALWVPAFYRALAGSAPSPVLALREAQLALRRSRAFRHPFYWAGLGHLQGLS